MNPKVSVIVPVYNVSEYLGQCLDTILLQTLQDIEVICVDDGSTDDSLDILNMYANLDDRIKVIHQENKGGAAARNRGLKEAKGEFIIFLDSDDFFNSEMLEKMVNQAQTDNSDVVVCGWYQFLNEKQSVVQQMRMSDEYIQKSPLKGKDFGKNLFIFAANVPWNKLVRADFLKRTGILFDEGDHTSSDDVYYSLCVVGLADFISVMSDSFIYYRINPKGLTASKKEGVVSDLCRTLSKTYHYLKNKNLDYPILPAFCQRVKKSLSWRFQDFPKGKIAHFLPLIKNDLDAELYHFLFNDHEGVKVSIIIPTYNAGDFLPECLDSCVNQSLKEIEIICVDDGSTDNSLNILNDYAKRDDRIKVLHQENKGLPISRNNAMKLATGEYIQFLDADDYLDLNTCECLYLYGKIYNLDMLFFSAIEFQNDTHKEFEEPYHCLKWLPENFVSVFTWKNVKEIMMSVAVTACLTFYRHDFLKKNNIHWLNKKLCYEDSPFFIESFLRAERVGALPQQFYHRRVHKAAITQNMSSNFLDYCEISKITLKIAKQYADEITFSNLFYGYVIKTWKNYLNQKQGIRIKFIQGLLEHYRYLKNEYKLPLPEEFENLLKIFSNFSPIKGDYHVGILYIATGKYIQLWDKFYQAAEKYFLPNCKKTYFLFTDQHDLDVPKNVIPISILNEQWPYITLKRYHYFCDQKEKLKKFDYLYFMNANLVFQSTIGNEILPTKDQGIMVTIHPWYLTSGRKSYTYETNPKSKAYISPEEGEYYFMGGFNGGTSQAFLEMAETIKNWTDSDLQNGIIPLWHDESMLNRYLIDYMKHKFPLILFPNYVVPGEMNLQWEGIKGILLDKKKELGMDYLKSIKKY